MTKRKPSRNPLNRKNCNQNSRLNKTLKAALGPFDSSASTMFSKASPRPTVTFSLSSVTPLVHIYPNRSILHRMDPGLRQLYLQERESGVEFCWIDSKESRKLNYATSCKCRRSLNKPFEFPEPQALMYTVVINCWESSWPHHSMTMPGLHRHSRLIHGSVGED